ncbi:hypothetical protein [Geothrix rubra]|uniref:hypothetical protein n=1 Tax=Geothrix rubra TaxID=2927977 RepID=UPI0025539426|nr:hypothetical protein [Geothrix rubra]
MELNHSLGLAWFQNNVKARLHGDVIVRLRSFSDGDFGDLEEVELERDNLIAYINFWSRDMIGFGAVTSQGDSVVETEMIEVCVPADYDSILRPLIKLFT